MFHRSGSTSLEAEALNYFKLDEPAHIHSFGQTLSSVDSSSKCKQAICSNRGQPSFATTKYCSTGVKSPEKSPKSTSEAMISSRTVQPKVHHKRSQRIQNSNAKILHSGEGSRTKLNLEEKTSLDQYKVINQNNREKKRIHEDTVLAVSPFLVSSSTTSTNSLPSISSSPSVSPSLVCPHISLDDILTLRNDSKSAHTIGLCARCRLNPPIDVQSPLSPSFKPSMAKRQTSPSHSNLYANDLKPMGRMRRGYSDQHMNNRIGKHRADSIALSKRHSSRLLHHGSQDDSLDHCLDPGELKRLQMSPSLRNSVEFIRKNQTEAGRVVVIHKNGQPYEKPLRICVMRNEFSTLNHLLDHINGRQLVPSGARYLFHMDGQLVYSVNELKHGSTYIVSGSRNFDFRANSFLREKLSKQIESSNPANQRNKNLYLKQVGTSPVQNKPLVEQSENLKSHNTSTNRKAPLPAATYGTQSNEKNPLIRKNQNRITNKKDNHSEYIVSVRQQQQQHQQNAKSQQIMDFTFDDEPEMSSKSQENLAAQTTSREKPVILVRAKSELGAGIKRKKNVTFVDTGRGSSPALSDRSIANKMQTSSTEDLSGSVPLLSASEVSLKEALSTNEIGIQVSDSIEGFLIDLPIAMPNVPSRTIARKSYLRKGEGSRASQRVSPTKSPPKKPPPFGSSPIKAEVPLDKAKPRRQVVTITERQLSLDEMNQLRDLNLGDHHHEESKSQPVIIKLDHVEDIPRSPDEYELRAKEVQKEEEKQTTPQEQPLKERRKLEKRVESKTNQKIDLEKQTVKEDSQSQWQFPGGRQASASPNERSVSQCEPSESMQARVTTPTPSLSTVDNSSLTMSYDASGVLQRTDSQQSQVDLPQKQRVPVQAYLCDGLSPPAKGFSLKWVNGFIINDLYPDNSGSGGTRLNLSGTKTPPTHPSERALLSPMSSDRPSINPFKPSDRFNNWICHSRRHDEIIYPVGSLVILWCRWTNEQRYYSKHSSNVSCLALASLDEDLAASGQFADFSERSNALIHLWSLTSLQTLLVIDEDLFYSRKIYSIRLKHNKSDGLELTLGCKDDKHLWLYMLKANLLPPDEGERKGKVTTKTKPISVIKVEKLLQANQVPLMVTRLSNQQQQQQQSNDASISPNKKLSNTDIVLSFGRRHFQLWLVDRRQRKMRLMQSESKSSRFIDSIMKANCLVKMAPTEFLVGDAEGNITLLMINVKTEQQQQQKQQKPLFSSTDSQRYTLETVHLLSQSSSEMATEDKMQQQLNPIAITCLARVSGNLFASGDSSCVVKFWRIERGRRGSVNGNKTDVSLMSSSCRMVSSITLPPDMGFICSIVVSRYNRKQSIVDFYVVSTSNAILFGSVQLQTDSVSKDILANSSLSVVYEGHETSALNLVADRLPETASSGNSAPKHRTQSSSISPNAIQVSADYFTCSIDCKICKWSGKNLVWKSMLPSACSSLAIHPIGFVLAVGAADGTVYIIDKFSGLLISYFPLTPVCINCLAYSRDGLLLAAGCANGSIFILPVYERGLKYKKVSIFQSPYPVVSLQFSNDNQFILTSVTNGSYQELILWDLPNFRYMRQGVRLAADKLDWYDPICSGSEDVRAIWENANLLSAVKETPKARNLRRLTISSTSSLNSVGTTINLSCHRLIRSGKGEQELGDENLVIASDTRGYLRMFCHPCYDIQQGFYEVRTSSSPINCCRFLPAIASSNRDSSVVRFVSTSLDGSICLWEMDS